MTHPILPNRSGETVGKRAAASGFPDPRTVS